MPDLKTHIAAACTVLFLLLPGCSAQPPAQAETCLHYTISDDILHLQIDNADDLTENTVFSYVDPLNDSISHAACPRIPTEGGTDTALYAVNDRYEGVIVTQDGLAQYFPWYYQTPRQIPPRLSRVEGSGQVCCITNSASGTGVALYDLHLFRAENGKIIDDYYDYEAFSAAFESIISDVSFHGSSFSFRAGGELIEVTLPSPDWTVTSISCGENINSITYKNGVLTVTGMVQAFADGLPGDGYYSGALQATAEVSNGEIQLSNITWLPDWDE